MSVRPSASRTEEGARFGSQDVEEVKGCGRRIAGEQRFDVGICT